MLIDFHSHILPGIDDGSGSLALSVEMLQAEAEQGVDHVVCTPHFYAKHDKPEAFLQRRARAAEVLRDALCRQGGLPGITVGAEVYYFRGMANSELLPQLTIGQSPYIMVEMPQGPWQESAFEELLQIRRNWGLTPIIAHIDRYIRPLRTYGIPERLAKLPVLVQANAEFFQDRRTKAMAIRMLKDGKIHLLGSDCHNMGSRKPNLGEAAAVIESRLGREALAAIWECSRDVLDLDI